ncbi:9407_t:CDS:2, partial [Acaulospora colombiana]
GSARATEEECEEESTAKTAFYPESQSCCRGVELDIDDYTPTSTASEVFYSARPLSSASISSYYFGESQYPSAGTPSSATFHPPGSFPQTPFTQTPQAQNKPPIALPHVKESPASSTPSSLRTNSKFFDEPPLVYEATDLLETLMPLNYPSSS